jgi:hypothetical protein
MIYETDTDLTYIYGGSAWQQVSGGTAVGNSGLVYITSASATSGTTLAIANVFSSTYENYKIVVSDLRLAGAAFVDFFFTGTTTNYAFGRIEVPYNTATAIGRGGSGTGLGGAWNFLVGDTSSNGGYMDIFGPNLARQTSFVAFAPDPRTGGSYGTEFNGGIQTSSTQFTGFTLSSGATITNMNCVVYGYRKA